MTHYDFVEIGTSDYDTLLQSRPAFQKGVSVDPMRMHLEKLPYKYNVTKVRAAIGETAGRVTFFYVHPSDILKYKLPFFLRGCTMVGKPHPLAVQQLEKRNLLSIMRNDSAEMMTLETLFQKRCVKSVGTFKVDVEGFDTSIVHAMIQQIDKGFPPPQEIVYEANWLDSTRRSLMRQINSRLINLGYVYSWKGRAGSGEPSEESVKKHCTTEAAGSESFHCWDQTFVRSSPLNTAVDS